MREQQTVVLRNGRGMTGAQELSRRSHHLHVRYTDTPTL